MANANALRGTPYKYGKALEDGETGAAIPASNSEGAKSNALEMRTMASNEVDDCPLSMRPMQYRLMPVIPASCFCVSP